MFLEMAASPFLWVQTFGETRPMGDDFLEALKLIDPPVSLSREIGTHVIGDLSGIASHLLSDEVFLMKILKEGLESECFTILGQQSLKFPGEESGVGLLYSVREPRRVS